MGYQKTITHLDGRVISISSDDIVQPGQITILEGEGMPIPGEHGKGNLYVHLHVQIHPFTEEQLTELEEFFDEHKIK